MSNHAAIAIMIAALWACSEIAVADEGDDGYTDWELPDAVFVRRECETIAKEDIAPTVDLEGLLYAHCGDKRDAHDRAQCRQETEERIMGDVRKARRERSARVKQLCDDAKTGKLDGDTWLKQIQPLAQSIADSLSCRNCAVMGLKDREPMPSGFESYSIFLAPNGLAQEADLPDLEATLEAYRNFGDAIGDRRAAIWFRVDRHWQVVEREWESAKERVNGSTEVDVLRSKAYCDRFGLSYNDGPYIVTTRRRPDQVADGEERIVIRLSGLPLKSVVRVLNILEQDLRMARQIRKRALLFMELKERLVAAGRELAKAFRQTTIVVSPSLASPK